MSEVKWIKLSTEIFNDEAIELIEQMPEGDAILVIWFKLLVKAGQVNDNGLIYVKKDLPYSEETLSQVFKKPLNIIKLALATFQKFGMIEILTSDEIMLTNWEKYQNLTAMDKMREDARIRKQRQRERQRENLRLLTSSPTLAEADFRKSEAKRTRELEQDVTPATTRIIQDLSINEKTMNLLKQTGATETELKEYITKFQTLPQKETDSTNTTARLLNFVKKLHQDKVETEEKEKAKLQAANEEIKERQRQQEILQAETDKQTQLKDAICDKTTAIEYLRTYYSPNSLKYSQLFKELSAKYDFTIEDCKNASN